MDTFTRVKEVFIQSTDCVWWFLSQIAMSRKFNSVVGMCWSILQFLRFGALLRRWGSEFLKQNCSWACCSWFWPAYFPHSKLTENCSTYNFFPLKKMVPARLSCCIQKGRILIWLLWKKSPPSPTPKHLAKLKHATASLPRKPLNQTKNALQEWFGVAEKSRSAWWTQLRIFWFKSLSCLFKTWNQCVYGWESKLLVHSARSSPAWHKMLLQRGCYFSVISFQPLQNIFK